jgi:phosphoribosylaminoimidazolecarboxamide formyltransferase / IMP cyclohydrolase
MSSKKFRQALVSVSDKSGLVEFLRPLVAQGMEIISTGGTARHLRENGIASRDISEHTGFPEVMDGRVKTLHPRVHMALLSRADHPEDLELLSREKLQPIDLLVVNLYPFEAQLDKNLSEPEKIEFIDIGGPTLLRAAAKNFNRVTVACDPSDYGRVLELGAGDLDFRRQLAAKVFAHVSSYDALIASELGIPLDNPDWSLGGAFVKSLRYGENPHQSAVWLRRRGARSGLHEAEILQGKELSYNNLLDLDAACLMASDYEMPCAVAVKHNNPCGVAIDRDPGKALEFALKADPVSVFGGIVATNFSFDANMAAQVEKIFLECIVAPDFSEAALKALAARKNLRVLRWPELPSFIDELKVRSINGGILVQSADKMDRWSRDWKVLGDKPSDAIVSELELAWKVAGRLKSNAIAVVGNGQTYGLGMGQVNRVDSVIQALGRWKQFHSDKAHAVLASDAFFPFADSIDRIAETGIRWIIQPGGSLRDEDVFARAKEKKINMVLTGRRHFSH